ncbi:MAG: PspC domain-containing protein [Methanomassiliicoccales archaeon]
MKQLHRSKQNQMVAGVAGGLAEYFAVDVALVRLIWVLAVLAGGAGVLAYIVLWVVLPVEENAVDTDTTTVWPVVTTDGNSESAYNNHSRSHRNAGVLLIGLGLIFLAGQFIPHWIIGRSWPLLLVLIGLYLLFRQRKENG